MDRLLRVNREESGRHCELRSVINYARKIGQTRGPSADSVIHQLLQIIGNQRQMPKPGDCFEVRASRFVFGRRLRVTG